MRILWSVPVRGERLDSSRGDMVRARSLIGGLRALGHEVRVVEAADDASASAAVSAYRGTVKRLLPSSAALLLRDAGRWMHGRRHAARVVAACAQYRADLLIETQVHGSDSGARAAAATGLPLILDDCSPASEEAELGAALLALIRRLFRRQLRAARIVAVSSSVLAQRVVADGADPARVRVVPNGVAADAFAPADRAAARERFGLGTDIGIVFVGSFQPWHRVDMLVDAVAQLRERYPVRLLLTGAGPALAPAVDRARSRGIAAVVSVVSARTADEFHTLLAACDIGALAGSNDYGQPMKLLDYAAAGLPAVAPDLPPVREVVDPGVTGLLFPPGDGAALQLQLVKLVTDPALRGRLGSTARERVAGVTWDARARELVRGFESGIES